MSEKSRARLFYLGLAVAVFTLEVAIALWVHDAVIRPYVGDVLVVVGLYALVRVFVPRGLPHLPAGIFIFAAAVEVSQAFHLVARLGLAESPVMRTLMGGTFDWQDLLCYLAGCLLIGGVAWRRQKNATD
ncbi:DUF2809 domain-containing protein [Pseudoramibacter alactolyticus]|uniref:ribosomal maturation YjgA family protein n=1 Tax=Pseudoramibacter alactolyticus TaxID=113287 RepID=UPI0028ED8090|nr:DUF2809 domain-containing protein [Pseudoramibacter alactolyticus]